jgi:predicted RNase H-like HicB family nuclease
MKLPIKIVYLVDEQEYCVFVDGLKGIEGRGESEEDAIDDFKIQCDKSFKE